MREHLHLAVWQKPVDCEFTLGEVEGALLQEFQPPAEPPERRHAVDGAGEGSASGDGRGGASLGGRATRSGGVSLHSDFEQARISREASLQARSRDLVL